MKKILFFIVLIVVESMQSYAGMYKTENTYFCKNDGQIYDESEFYLPEQELKIRKSDIEFGYTVDSYGFLHFAYLTNYANGVELDIGQHRKAEIKDTLFSKSGKTVQIKDESSDKLIVEFFTERNVLRTWINGSFKNYRCGQKK